MPTGATRTAPAGCASRRRAASSTAPSTAMVNPYLMAAALLKAFDDGIRRKLDPGRARAAQHLPGDGGRQRSSRSCRCRWARRWTRLTRTRSSRRRCPARCTGSSCTTSATSGSGSWPPSPNGTLQHVSGLLAMSDVRLWRSDYMCGIAGFIHRGGSGDIGREMTAMLQSLKHRGPDSSGFASTAARGRRTASCASRSPSRRTSREASTSTTR